MDDLTERVLRIHPEPCEVVDDRTVHRRLTADPAGYVDFVRKRLHCIADASATLELPPKQVLSDGIGDFRMMPCIYRADGVSLKTAKIVGTNTVQVDVPDQITVGKAFLLHSTENYLTHIFDACILSSARTGACLALALAGLAPAPGRLGIVGAGRVGYYAGLYAATLPGVQAIVIHDRLEARAEAAVQLLTRESRAEVPFAVGRPSELRAHDTVMVCTTSDRPIFEAADLDARTVLSAGADVPEQRELGSSWAPEARVYVDSRDAAVTGDLLAWKAEGAIRDEDLTGLVDLLGNGPPSADEDRNVFISGGSALMDNLTIAYLVRDDLPGG